MEECNAIIAPETSTIEFTDSVDHIARGLTLSGTADMNFDMIAECPFRKTCPC